MNQQAEQFRRITMKVLTMQLNSITIMDLIAYGGAAAGMALAVSRFAAGRVDLAGALFIILLAAEFFLPMRLLGSFFHVAMNGMAAAERIFRLLDLPEVPAAGGQVPEEGGSVTVGGRPLEDISEAALARHITYISHNSYLFKGLAVLQVTDSMKNLIIGVVLILLLTAYNRAKPVRQ